MAAVSEEQVTMLMGVFPAIPAEPIRRAIEITGSVEAASEWFLENDWRELQQDAFLLGGPAGGNGGNAGGGQGLGGLEPRAGVGGGEDEDDEDDEDEDEDDELLAADGAALAAAVAHRQLSQRRSQEAAPAAKKRKVVRQEPAPADGARSFWCAFDATVVHKSHLQLMNLRPRTLGHARIVLSKLDAAVVPKHRAEAAVADVWSDVSADRPGYWLVPVLAADVDDVWWKILEPHLLRNCFADVLVFQTVAPLKSGASTSSTTGAASSSSTALAAAAAAAAASASSSTTTTAAATATASASPSPSKGGLVQTAADHESSSSSSSSASALLQRAIHRLPRFDDVEERSAGLSVSGGQNSAWLQHQIRLARQRAATPNAPAAALVILASGSGPELRRVGEYLAALFPTKTPLYFRRLKGTAADASKKVAFANDPRADPDCLHPDWHSKHSDLRVVRRQPRPLNPEEQKTALGIFTSQPKAAAKFDVERKRGQGADTNDWRPYTDQDDHDEDLLQTPAPTSSSSSSSSDPTTTNNTTTTNNNNNNNDNDDGASSDDKKATTA